MNIYRAAVCEDSARTLEVIHEQLSKEFLRQNFKIEFDCYTEPEVLLETCRTGTAYHILFLDIDMPGINGIELCRRIQCGSPNVLTVFISGKDKMVFQTFQVRPFRFIRKSHFTEELPALVNDIIHEMRMQEGTSISIEELHSGNLYSLNTNQILYIEALVKDCRIVLTSQEIQIHYKLKDFEALLKQYGFLRPHRSFLVNYRYIFSIQKTSLILDNGQHIPLSRNRVDTVKEEFITLNYGGA